MSIEDVVKRGSRACEYALIAMESEGHGLRASETLGVALAVREKVGCSGDRRARSARAPVTLYALKGRTYAGRKTLRPVLWRASQPAWASSVANTVSRDQPRAWIPAYNAETFILAGLFGSTKPSVTRKEPEQWHGFQASPSCDEPTDAEVAKLLHELAFPRVESVLANCTESTGGPVQCEQPLATVHAPLFVYPPKYGSTAAALYPYARLHDAIKGLLEAARRRAEPGLTSEDVILQLDEDENIKIDEVAFNSFIEHDNMRYSLRSNGKPAGTFWRTPSAGGPGATRVDNEPVRYILRADLRCVECNRTAPSPTTTCICYACGSGRHRNCLSSQQRNDFDRLGEAWQCSVCEVGKAPAPLPSTLSSAGASEEIDVGQRPRAADQSVNRRPKRLIYQKRVNRPEQAALFLEGCCPELHEKMPHNRAGSATRAAAIGWKIPLNLRRSARVGALCSRCMKLQPLIPALRSQSTVQLISHLTSKTIALLSEKASTSGWTRGKVAQHLADKGSCKRFIDGLYFDQVFREDFQAMARCDEGCYAACEKQKEKDCVLVDNVCMGLRNDLEEKGVLSAVDSNAEGHLIGKILVLQRLLFPPPHTEPTSIAMCRARAFKFILPAVFIMLDEVYCGSSTFNQATRGQILASSTKHKSMFFEALAQLEAP
eukprot:jgi/Tetstr1/441184/TSEL_029442.t2